MKTYSKLVEGFKTKHAVIVTDAHPFNRGAVEHALKLDGDKHIFVSDPKTPKTDPMSAEDKKTLFSTMYPAHKKSFQVTPPEATTNYHVLDHMANKLSYTHATVVTDPDKHADTEKKLHAQNGKFNVGTDGKRAGYSIKLNVAKHEGKEPNNIDFVHKAAVNNDWQGVNSALPVGQFAPEAVHGLMGKINHTMGKKNAPSPATPQEPGNINDKKDVKEEVELNELNKTTLKSYKSKAIFDLKSTTSRLHSFEPELRSTNPGKDQKTAVKRIKGINAVNRSLLNKEFKEEAHHEVTWTDRDYKKYSKKFIQGELDAPDKSEKEARAFAKNLDSEHAKSKYGTVRSINTEFHEAVENLEELSKDTLGSYIKKAASSAVVAADGRVRAQKSHPEFALKLYDKSLKRQYGVIKATDKLVAKVNESEETEDHEYKTRLNSLPNIRHPDYGNSYKRLVKDLTAAHNRHVEKQNSEMWKNNTSSSRDEKSGQSYVESVAIGSVVLTNDGRTAEVINIGPNYVTLVSEGKTFRKWTSEVTIAEGTHTDTVMEHDQIVIKGYKTKNFTQEVTKQFSEIIKENTDTYAVYNLAVALDNLLGLTEEAVTTNFENCRKNFDRAVKYAARFNVVFEQLSAVEDTLLEHALCENVKFAANDKAKVANIIAATTGVLNEGEPHEIVNRAAQSYAGGNRKLTTEGWKILGSMLNKATEANIQWDKSSLNPSIHRFMGLK